MLEINVHWGCLGKEGIHLPHRLVQVTQCCFVYRRCEGRDNVLSMLEPVSRNARNGSLGREN